MGPQGLVRWLHIEAFIGVLLCWLGFAAAFFTHRRPASPGPAMRRESASIVGIVFQGLAYAAAWMMERRRFTPIVLLPGWLVVLPPLLAVILAALSARTAYDSIRTLGREWSLEARLVEGHRLVTDGPYGRMRHPIYGAMLGMLIATCLVVSHWLGLIVALVLFLIGTAIRVRSEERLLRSQFGAAYDDYARRVPAIVPRIIPR